MDRITEHWATHTKDWDLLKGDIKNALIVFNAAVTGLLEQPTLNRGELCETAFCELGRVLDCVDPTPSKGGEVYIPSHTFKEGLSLFKAPTGTIEPLKPMLGYDKASIGDEEQKLLCLDRTDLWNGRLETLSAQKNEGGGALLLSNEQLETIRKCRLIDPVSHIEHELLSDTRLFTDDVETIIKRTARDYSTHNREYWQKAVVKARALYVGLKSRERA